MVAIAECVPEMTDRGNERLASAMATITPANDFALAPSLIAKRDELLALV
jgi:hypothetical protein